MSYQLLIVDDEVLIRKALSQYIDWESLNCVVHATASNGKEAIKIIEENKIDIVITDVKMPLIDGIELSRYICKNHPNITTVICTVCNPVPCIPIFVKANFQRKNNELYQRYRKAKSH